MSSWRLPVFVGGVAAAGVAAFAGVATREAFAGFAALAPAAALLTLYGEWRAPYIPGFGALNFAEPVYFAVALERGPAQAAALAAGVGVAGDFLRRKRPAVKVFNLGWALLTFTAVGAVARWLGYDGFTHLSAAWPVLAAAAVYFVVAGGLQAVAQTLLESMTLRETIASQFGLMRYSVLSALCLGGACAALMRSSPWLMLLLAFPMEVLSSYLEKDRLNRELVATQGALVQAEKRAALGVMAAGVAHELNTPLAAILVNSHMLRDPRTQIGDQTQCLNLVEKATHRAQEIVASLLAASRPTAAASGDAEAALREATALLGTTVEGSLQGLPPVAMATSELASVLTNVVKNAILAKRDRIQVRGRATGGQVIIEVEDDGSGIDAEHLPRIWDPFFTTRAVGSGTGLGLWLCRNLVEGARGRIAVMRSGPEGTVFEITLPQAAT